MNMSKKSIFVIISENGKNHCILEFLKRKKLLHKIVSLCFIFRVRSIRLWGFSIRNFKGSLGNCIHKWTQGDLQEHNHFQNCHHFITTPQVVLLTLQMLTWAPGPHNKAHKTKTNIYRSTHQVSSSSGKDIPRTFNLSNIFTGRSRFCK